MSERRVDVLVVGGGAAGLSAAVALARFRRGVVVVDAGAPRNAPADGVHNYLTRDGLPPLALQALGRAELEGYGGQVRRGTATGARRTEGGFEVDLDGGGTVTGRRLLVASGLQDELPDVEGLAPRWGRDVLHCPYCHGWEVRDTVVGVLGTTAFGAHQALLFRQLTDRVRYLSHIAPALSQEQREQFAALDIEIEDGRVTRLQVQDDRLTAAMMEDGRTVALDALVVTSRAVARSPVLDALGLATQPHPLGADVAESYPADPTGATTLPGVWVAGNVTDAMAQVVTSAAAGLAAAAAINADLIAADVERAVTAARHKLPAPASPAEWERRYAAAEQVWSGNPNGALVAETTQIAPARALDVGCGEGADAVWLALRGWDVTGLDVSQVALDRARATAEQAGVTVRWLHTGLFEAGLPASGFELVSVQYPALLRTPDDRAEHALLDAVAPGGTLLVVHHADVDAEQAKAHGFDPADYVGHDDLAALLDEAWQVETAERRPRQVQGGGGAHHTHDLILKARRLP